MAREATSAAEAVARRSYGKLVAFLAARMGDVEAAEDALSEAFAAALTDWDAGGIPDNPEGWLVTVAAQRRGLDPPSPAHCRGTSRGTGRRRERPVNARPPARADVRLRPSRHR